MKPIIGITTYGRNEITIETIHYDAYYCLPALYVDAVRRAGGIPILLPPGEPNWRDLLPTIDGIIVSGGVDVDPMQYRGDSRHPQLTELNPERDSSEISLLRQVIHEMPMPTLCICRGMQVLNVAGGGTLNEHIPDIREIDIHRNEAGGWAVQEVLVAPESFLAQILHTTTVKTYSGHHQAVKAVAPGFSVVATAPDGIVEALEMAGHPWLVAVQWHPEMSAASDPSQQRIFDELVKAAATK